MHILVTINRNYIYPLLIMLYSLMKNNKGMITVYIMHTDLNDKDKEKIESYFNSRLKVNLIKIDDSKLKNAPVSKQFPITMYYRLFAWKYLPKELDRVLYLDPDIIVLKDLSSLYNMDFNDNIFIASTHVKRIVKAYTTVRLSINYKDIYINSGVLLINLEELRKEKLKEEDIYNYIRENKERLSFPDQDVISKLYRGKIKKVSASIYNLSRLIAAKYPTSWIDKNTKIIHYCGKAKPWNKKHYSKLDYYFLKYEEEFKKENKKEVR